MLQTLRQALQVEGNMVGVVHMKDDILSCFSVGIVLIEVSHMSKIMIDNAVGLSFRSICSKCPGSVHARVCFDRDE